MDDRERLEKMLERVREQSLHSRYVLGATGDDGYLYGYVGMGETMGRRLSPAELVLLRQLLSEGLCTLGAEVNLASADWEKEVDPDTGRMYHKELYIVGRLVEPLPGNPRAEA